MDHSPNPKASQTRADRFNLADRFMRCSAMVKVSSESGAAVRVSFVVEVFYVTLHSQRAIRGKGGSATGQKGDGEEQEFHAVTLHPWEIIPSPKYLLTVESISG